jgi:hypothetical protein
MLRDAEEQRIMAGALQPKLRSPDNPDRYLKAIFRDFLDCPALAGQRILELGPGHFDFAELLRGAGAEVVAIDNDPAVVALGVRRGFVCHHAYLQHFDFAPFRGAFDGLFCRGSINAFWYPDDRDQIRFVNAIGGVLNAEGWGFVTPANGLPSEAHTPERLDAILESQKRALASNGFESHEVTKAIAAKYGLNDMVNRIVFLRRVESLFLTEWNTAANTGSQ